jgi:hypothetical protein
MLTLVGLLMSHAARPQTWRWLEEAHAQDELVAAPPADAPDAGAGGEPVVPGAIETDPAEREAAEAQFRNLRDKTPMSVEEMPPYWRLMKWARAQSFADLARRARTGVFFTQLWEQPQKHRGVPIQMRLHVRRVLSHEAPENSAGVARVYELWGVTDESRAHPYGAQVFVDVDFAGYFLKLLGYEASDNRRAAPLLIGRLHAAPVPAVQQREKGAGTKEFWRTAIIGGSVTLRVLAGAWLLTLRRRAVRNGWAAAEHQRAVESAQDWLSRGA